MSHPEHNEQHESWGGRGRSEGGRGEGRRGGRGHRFERGDLRYVLLERLAGQPAHGYELIRALEERFHGFYSPSPGVVYPTLQWLEDLGYVTVAEADGRKVYTITEEGRSFLTAGGPRVAEIDRRLRGWLGHLDRGDYRAEIEGIRDDLQGMGQALREASRGADPERLHRVREVTRRAREEITAILGEPAARAHDEPLDG